MYTQETVCTSHAAAAAHVPAFAVNAVLPQLPDMRAQKLSAVVSSLLLPLPRLLRGLNPNPVLPVLPLLRALLLLEVSRPLRPAAAGV